MIKERLLWGCLSDMVKLEAKLREVNEKVDHIIFRLREMDARIGTNGEGDEDDMERVQDEHM
jgi:hypothetical protein